MSGIVIDASVAIKWVVNEEGSEDAVRLIDGPKLSASDLPMSECAYILWKKAWEGELSRDEALLSIDLLIRADIEFVPTRALASVVMVLSLDLDHPAYDCMYLALAVERGVVFRLDPRNLTSASLSLIRIEIWSMETSQASSHPA